MREEVTEATADAGDSVGFRRLIRSSTKKKGKPPHHIVILHPVDQCTYVVCMLCGGTMCK